MSASPISLKENLDIEFEIVRGDDITWGIITEKVQDSNDHDLTNVTEIIFTVKLKNTTDALITKKVTTTGITIDDVPNGRILLALVPGDTNPLELGVYVCDLEYLDNGKILTALTGTLEILGDSTRP